MKEYFFGKDLRINEKKVRPKGILPNPANILANKSIVIDSALISIELNKR